MWRLFIPLKYLEIDHPEKRKFDLYVPLALALFFSVPLLSSAFRTDVLAGRLSVVENIGNLLGLLTGFFIASLAAVATFGKTEMDVAMPGEPPVRLEHRTNRETYFEDLTRRRFLSFLFGYLAFVALTLCVIGYSYFIADRYFLSWAYPDARQACLVVFWMVFMFFISNVLSNTLLGLYYLTDRIHRANKVIRKPEDKS